MSSQTRSRCPACQARYQLSRANLGHRTICLKCGGVFHLLPASDQAPTIIPPGQESPADDLLVGRLWLDLRPGQIVAGRYRVVRPMGRGGLSLVSQMEDLENSRRPLALKLPLPATLDRLPRRAFIDEAVAWLTPGLHPNLVGCDHVELFRNQPLIFQDFIDGHDLWTFMGLGRGPLYEGPEEAVLHRLLDSFIQIARGLAYAHSLGLSRLDIKPRNVLVENGGRVLIGDYGPLSLPSANLAADQSRPASSQDATRFSSTRLLGTPQYFSPEAALGRSGPGPGDDLWALSLTALECFIGRRPWEMGSIAGQALEHYLAGPRPKAPIAPPLADFFRRALADKIADRPQTAREVEEDLAAVYRKILRRPYPRPAPPPRPEPEERRRRRAAALQELGRAELIAELGLPRP
ncbi:MAG: serine/threonine protein kinase [Candidatus Adiutrix sp.]|jgi:serine/threonine protein kinase|nr:serine/threonine protein kinase [Candidatus Adiutrix sp.]